MEPLSPFDLLEPLLPGAVLLLEQPQRLVPWQIQFFFGIGPQVQALPQGHIECRHGDEEH